MIRRHLVSAAIVFVAVPTLGIVLPEPEYCTAPPVVVGGQAIRCPEPKPVVVQHPDAEPVTPEGPAETGGVNR